MVGDDLKLIDKLMEKIADGLSSKTCFFIFCIIAFIPLLIEVPNSILTWQQFVSQTVIQLIALNVLAIVNKKESRETRKLLQEIHDTVMNELQIVKVEQISAKEDRDNLKEILETLKEDQITEQEQNNNLAEIIKDNIEISHEVRMLVEQANSNIADKINNN